MHKPSPRYPKINYNRRQLMIEILTKSNMTSKLSPISCQNGPYSADWVIYMCHYLITIFRSSC